MTSCAPRSAGGARPGPASRAAYVRCRGGGRRARLPCRDGALRVLGMVRSVGRCRPRSVPPAAGGLEEARGGDAQHHASGQHRQRLAATEVLDVTQNPVRVRLAQVTADSLDPIRGLVGQPGGSVLALLAQLLSHAPEVGAGRADPLTGLRRALVDLLPQARARLAGRLLCLITGLACDLLCLLLCLLCRALLRLSCLDCVCHRFSSLLPKSWCRRHAGISVPPSGPHCSCS